MATSVSVVTLPQSPESGAVTAQKMATESERRVPAKVWGQKSKIDEELDYFTELALHESERWIQV